LKLAWVAGVVALGVANCKTSAPQERPVPSATPAPAPSLKASPPPVASAASVESQRNARFDELARGIEAKPGCTEYGILLSIAWPSQPSRSTWLAETLRAEPTLRAWLAPEGGIQLMNILYGPRNYGTGMGNQEAFVLQCTDAERCRMLAGFYAQVQPGAKPKPFCGAIPGNTGGPNPVDVDKLLARPRPFPHGVCARYRACLVAQGLAPASCDGFELSARACAELPDCRAALACLESLPRNPKKPLWSDEPARPRHDFF